MKRFATIFWQTAMIGLLCISTLFMSACTVDQILTDVDVVLQTANSLSVALGAISPADALIVSTLTGLAENGVNAIKADYASYEANKTASKLQDVLVAAQAVQTNLPAELAAAKISDPTTAAKVSNWVNLVTDVVGGIISTIQGTKAMATASTHGIVMAMPTPESLQARWQSGVCSGDVACGNLVKVHNKRAPFKL
jgi:hypothetical protein